MKTTRAARSEFPRATKQNEEFLMTLTLVHNFASHTFRLVGLTDLEVTELGLNPDTLNLSDSIDLLGDRLYYTKSDFSA